MLAVRKETVISMLAGEALTTTDDGSSRPTASARLDAMAVALKSTMSPAALMLKETTDVTTVVLIGVSSCSGGGGAGIPSSARHDSVVGCKKISVADRAPGA